MKIYEMLDIMTDGHPIAGTIGIIAAAVGVCLFMVVLMTIGG